MLTGCKQNCASCRFWKRQGPQIANAQRDPSCPKDEGICQFAPPVLTTLQTGPAGIFPRTHADRWCGRWFLRGSEGPDDGEHATVDTIIPFRRAS